MTLHDFIGFAEHMQIEGIIEKRNNQTYRFEKVFEGLITFVNPYIDEEILCFNIKDGKLIISLDS